ncbi:MAG: glycine cleavage T C-terminal barrel domain-containing protein [Alphaproteobacteria bacterium]
MSGTRLPAPAGARLDRTRPLRFTFEGESYRGFTGDTIASALAANGVRVLSRSFKYRRPRGLYSAGSHEACALVQLPDEPNVPADRRLLADGMTITGQNYAGSLARDRGAWIARFEKFMPVGFYYRTFFRPRGIWRVWERVIRKRAGLGRVNPKTPHGYHDKAYAFADVAVIGAGPAGMAAALAAAEAGAEVTLIDENPEIGGALTYGRFDADGRAADEALKRLAKEVREHAAITVLTDAVCTGLYEDNWLAIDQGRRLVKLRARDIVVATGLQDGIMVFADNDLPGIVAATTVQRLIWHHGVLPGEVAVVATQDEWGYTAALDLAEAGAEVSAILDTRDKPSDSALAKLAEERGIEVLSGWMPERAEGETEIERISAVPVDEAARETEEPRNIECDLLCVSARPTPAAALFAQGGAKLPFDPARGVHLPTDLPPGLHAAGAVNGETDLKRVIADGERVGKAAIAGETKPARKTAKKTAKKTATTLPPQPMLEHPEGKSFVDLDEDLTIGDIRDTVALGYQDVQLLKRFSTLGMGTSQGRHANPPGVTVAAEARGDEIGQVGLTTARPPLAPVAFGTLAGRQFSPVRRTSIHRWHVEASAQMMVAGAWLRPAYYGPPDEAESRIQEEAVAVRRSLGLIDVSTLGKLELRGREAGAFLDRLYTFSYQKLAVGKSRYALMTDETGAIIDDGVVCRLGEEHFYVTATTGGVDEVYRTMLWWNAQWRLDVDITNVTAGYAAMNLAGPASRESLAKLCDDVDLGAEAFPYLGVREGHVAGVPARILRTGFVGELGYEIHAPTGFGLDLWQAFMRAGEDAGIRPFGVEAQRLLRLEKGHIIVGQDTDGLTHPYEAGMDWAVSKKKPFFVGGRSIDIMRARGLTRRLVGYQIENRDAPLPKECHLVIRNGEIAGRVTSSAVSPTLGHAIGLAYVPPELDAKDGKFEIRVEGARMVEATVVPLPFYDPENARQEL